MPRLRCRVIAGAANNQLATDRIADRLAERGILWAPDFVANAGGLINIAQERGGYEPAVARRRVAGIGATLREIFDRSRGRRQHAPGRRHGSGPRSAGRHAAARLARRLRRHE